MYLLVVTRWVRPGYDRILAPITFDKARAPRRRFADQWWGLADVVVISVFVVVGHVNHHHRLTAGALTSTFWPFAVGWLAGTLSVMVRHRAVTAPSSGVAVALITVAIGMALRVLVGQGTAFAFILVATAFLGASMLGWRLLVRIARR